MKAAFACYFAFWLALVAFGVTYLAREEFMPYHAQGAGMQWAELPASFKPLVLTFMRALGGAMLTIALAFALILFGPFRKGARWARHALPIIGLAYNGLGLIPALYLASLTSAHTPWGMNLGAMALMVVGWASSSLPERPALAPR